MSEPKDYYDAVEIAAQETLVPVRLLHGCTGEAKKQRAI